MKRLFHKAFVILACLHFCGGHWGMLQVVAWSKMLVDYSAEDGMIEGVIKTFDGAHPCGMCKALGEGKKNEAERKRAPLNESVRSEFPAHFFLPSDGKELVAPAPKDVTEISAAGLIARKGGWNESPPVPPPRLA